MSAADTAVRVLNWAAGNRPEPPPRGDLADPRGLAEPSAELTGALGLIAAVTAARLRCGTSPPFGFPGPVGVGPALLAAAIGARAHPAALDSLLRAVPRPRSGWDHVARYGLAGAVQRSAARLSEAESELPLRLAWHAPLTGVLDAPGPVEKMTCTQLANAILAAPEGRAAVTGVLAEPCPSDDTAAWRGGLLERARPDHRDFVLDVYEIALSIHRREHAARRLLAEQAWRTGGPGPAVRATARWWTALAYLERRQRPLVRARPRLRGEDYLPGVRLHWTVAQATGGGS
jgi:hypothetical protein